MRIAVTGATGTIGRAVVRALLDRGDAVTALTRDAARARTALAGVEPSRRRDAKGEPAPPEVELVEWRDPAGEPAPAEALAGRDGVIHLLGEPIAQRWTGRARQAIRESRVAGTRNLVAGMRDAQPRPGVLVSQSAIGVYGARGDEPVDESAPAADDFLARVCADWEAAAGAASELGVRVVTARTGVVLAAGGGALQKMLPPFRLGLGGPVAGGRQYVPWVHLDDVAGALLLCLDTDPAQGPVNVTAPEPVTNRELSKALGRVLRRPAVAPVPALAVRLLYGEMAWVVTTGVRAVPSRLLELGYEFRRPELEDALRAATGR